MPRTPNDERDEALEPATPRQGNLNNRTGPQAPDQREDGGEARDQGDQTEDNRKQQE